MLDRLELERSAPVSTVPVRSLLDKSTSVRFVSERSASVNIVPVRSLPDRFTRIRFASLKLVYITDASVKSAFIKNEWSKSAYDKSAPVKSKVAVSPLGRMREDLTPHKFACDRLAYLKFVLVTFALYICACERFA